jgi:hypothetical protein
MRKVKEERVGGQSLKTRQDRTIGDLSTSSTHPKVFRIHRGVALADKANSPPCTPSQWDTMRLLTKKATTVYPIVVADTEKWCGKVGW